MHLLVDQGKNWDGIKLLSSRAISGENSLESMRFTLMKFALDLH